MKQNEVPSPSDVKNWAKWLKLALKIIVLILSAIFGDITEITNLFNV